MAAVLIFCSWKSQGLDLFPTLGQEKESDMWPQQQQQQLSLPRPLPSIQFKTIVLFPVPVTHHLLGTCRLYLGPSATEKNVGVSSFTCF